MNRMGRICAILIALMVFGGITPPSLVAAENPVPLTQQLIYVEQMGEGSLVSILAQIDESTPLPATVQIVVPSVFEPSSAEAVDASAGSPGALGDVEYTTSEYDDRNTAYTLNLTEGNGVLIRFAVPAGIFSQAANGHAAAKLEITSAVDVDAIAFQFVLPPGTIPAGDNVANLGNTPEGNVIAGQAFENIKAGESATALFAVGAAAEVANAVVSAEASKTAVQKFLSSDNLIVMVLIAAVVVLAAVAVALGVNRSRAAEDSAYDEDSVTDYDGGSEDEYGADLESSEDSADPDSDAVELPDAEAGLEDVGDAGSTPSDNSSFFRD